MISRTANEYLFIIYFLFPINLFYIFHTSLKNNSQCENRYESVKNQPNYNPKPRKGLHFIEKIKVKNRTKCQLI